MESSMYTKIVSLITSFLVLLSALAAIKPSEPVTESLHEVKNVIFMIGDGMGENHLEKTKQEMNISLVMETMTLRGQSKTPSYGGVITDSAAGGSALATGESTINGYVGVYPGDPAQVSGHPMNLCELAIEMGKKTGVVTTDSTGGATPAAFSVHTSSRSNDEDIAKQQVACGIDLIWGKSAGIIDAAETQANGKVYVSSMTEMNALTPDVKSYGQFTSDMWSQSVISGDNPTLTQMTEKAIELLDNDENGFFLMVEGAHIDKHSHSNNGESMKLALQEFDNAIAAALAFAEEDGETLVIVTADHETGAITYKNGSYQYTSGQHSSANVPLFVYGCDNFIEQGEAIKNTSVAIKTANAMGCTEFPRKAA